MVGTKRFSDEAVLDRAAEVFWRKGFDATSIPDLESATGLGRGSLYNAFGDKQALFLTVLSRYGRANGPPLHLLDGPDVFVGLRDMLHAHAARMNEPGRPRGCLVTNTCLSVGGGDPTPVDARVASGLRGIEARLEAAFARARDLGQIVPTAEPRRLARFYCAVLQSLGVLHKALADRSTLEDVIEAALTAWPAPPRPGAGDA